MYDIFIHVHGFILTKAKGRGYLAETITDADYTDDLVLLAYAPAQPEFALDQYIVPIVGNKRH